MQWIRRTIWFDGENYKAASGADISQVINDALVLTANLGETITVEVGGDDLEVAPGADPTKLRALVEKGADAKKAAEARREAKKLKKQQDAEDEEIERELGIRE
jgi:hypothetical protein